jgi:AraC-like DNA-binding protein
MDSKFDVFDNSALSAWCGKPEVSTRFHRHHEIELNFIEKGYVTYFRGSGYINLPAGHMAIFWAAVPHRPMDMDANTLFHYIYVPLAWFLQWDLPETFRKRVLGGEMIIEKNPKRSAPDLALFKQWQQDIKDKSSPEHKIAIMEISARLQRLALSVAGQKAGGLPDALPPSHITKVEQMACFIAEHYTEPLQVADVAKAVGLHPNYAMNLFHKNFGNSLVDYLTQHRISHSQRLLATRDDKILNIALESGFGSLSRFNAAFRKACLMSPRDYRKSMRRGA